MSGRSLPLTWPVALASSVLQTTANTVAFNIVAARVEPVAAAMQETALHFDRSQPLPTRLRALAK